MAKYRTLHDVDPKFLVWVLKTLQEYAETRPRHSAGLCYYLSEKSDKDGQAPESAPAYIVVSLLIEFTGTERDPKDRDYIDAAKGPTDKRVAFAEKAIPVLEGHLQELGLLPPTKVPRLPKPGTQLDAVLQSLRSGERNLAYIADDARCAQTAASARIRELRRDYGWPIETCRNKAGKKVFFTYHLEA
jgi:hypothetical protein